MHPQLDNLYQTLNYTYTNSIQDIADHIKERREYLNTILSDEVNLELTSFIKTKVQKEANTALDKNGGTGAFIGATGVGKTKVAINRCINLGLVYENPKILLVVPTIKLRDVGWRDEFTKWGEFYIWNHNVTAVCYDSLHTFRCNDYDLIILDECHHITEANSSFFFSHSNTWREIIALTATKPRSDEKLDILKRLNIFPVYEISLETSVKLGLVAPFAITMVGIELDDTVKYIKGGSEAKGYFYQTEKSAYIYRQKLFLSAPGRQNGLGRMRMLYGIRSKTEAAKAIMEHLIPPEERTLIFCGTQEQADEVCPNRYYSKPSKPKLKKDLPKWEKRIAEYQGNTSFKLFDEGFINTLSCCESLNEGQNIPDLDNGLGVQINSNDLGLIQRIGRVIRYRVGHRGKIIILYIKNTVDQEWAVKALNSFDKSIIKWVDYDKLRKGEETLNY